jgi:thiol-disulfide isomerase/thioredoxin
MLAVLELAALLLLSGATVPAHGARTAASSQKTAAARDPDAEAALEKAFAASGDDRSVLVRNLQQYLLEFPNAPRKPDIYRALVDACQQLHDDACALNYAERLIALRPDDSDMMLIAVNYLQRKGDDESLERASGYVTRVLDRVEKSLPAERPSGQSLAAWQARQQNLRGVLYYLRGEIHFTRQEYDAAERDLETSYGIRPSASTAERLGAIAELNGNPRKAIDEYALAFVLPNPGPEEHLDRREIRKRLGNVWREVHGSNTGLGDAILAAYDSVAPLTNPAGDDANKNVDNLFAFSLRRLDGTPMSLSTLKGKIMVLDFWATWCVSCQQVNAGFNELAAAWSSEQRVAFLMIDTDDNTDVAAYVQQQKWQVPVVYADGLDRFLKVGTLPAAVVIDANGKVVNHMAGTMPRNFASALSAAIQQALGTPH